MGPSLRGVPDQTAVLSRWKWKALNWALALMLRKWWLTGLISMGRQTSAGNRDRFRRSNPVAGWGIRGNGQDWATPGFDAYSLYNGMN